MQQDVVSRVPQCSILRPEIFLVFVYNRPRWVNSKIMMFSDDTEISDEVNSKNDFRQPQHDIKTPSAMDKGVALTI